MYLPSMERNERIGSVLNAGTNDDVSVMTDADWLRNSTKLSAGFGGGGFDAIAEESNDESSHPPSVDLEQLHNQSSHAFNESSNSIHFESTAISTTKRVAVWLVVITVIV